MSSHREAPEISKDPVADNTDTYAFVSPVQAGKRSRSSRTTCRPRMPAGGPNFFEFGNDVLYSIYIDNDGDGLPEITYEFTVPESKLSNPNTFLYNTGPIEKTRIEPSWNKRQFYHRSHRDRRISGRKSAGEQTAPVRPATSDRARLPNYSKLAEEADPLALGRADGLRGAAKRPLLCRHRLDLRPRRPAPVPEPPSDPDGRPEPSGSTRCRTLNVHTIAIQVPIAKPDLQRQSALRA